jgi:AefR-like transcriptional repressor, C-terminal domain
MPVFEAAVKTAKVGAIMDSYNMTNGEHMTQNKRLNIGEAVNCPEVGHAWYTHGPARTVSFIRSLLEGHRDELRETTITIERLAVMRHHSWTGDVLCRLLVGVGKHQNDAELERFACDAVDVVLGSVHGDVSLP